MTNTYITNATWALTGEKLDLRMGHGDEPVSIYRDGIAARMSILYHLTPQTQCHD